MRRACRFTLPAARMTAGNMQIHERLKLLRRKMRLNQADMATRMGVSLRAYQTYENNESKPKAEDIARLAGDGIDLNWLLTGEGEMLRAAPAQGAQPSATQPLDEALNAAIIEALSGLYAEFGMPVSGKAVSRVYVDIVESGFATWEEKMTALRLAIQQLRRRLGAANGDPQGKQHA